MMEKITINVGENGDYHTIREAVEAVPYDTPAIIRISEGVYKERLFIEKKDITLIGEGKEKTIITQSAGALDFLEDGTKRGTFRTWTMFLTGKNVKLSQMTVENTAGWGSKVGQAVAIYSDADHVFMEDMCIRSRQDTLFLSPLPVVERFNKGFFGPRMLLDRKNTRQYYKNCEILGDVDFIFGGADAVFDDCRITVMNRDKDINGYVTAPSENVGDLGFVFRNCIIDGEEGMEKETVFLGRPWRPTGSTTFLSCRYGTIIHPLRFCEWSELETDDSQANFAEYDPKDLSDEPIDISRKNKWVHLLDEEEAGRINDLSDALIDEIVATADE